MSADLVLASFNPTTLSLGTTTVLTRGQLVASPSFSPDGKNVAYLAPATLGGGFQLWTIPAIQSAAPTPRQITSELDLAATSAPLWIES
jgi:Tol biopolymer transport system component